MDSTLTFGQWLRQRRHQLDLTQEAVAEATSCSPDLIRKIEVGQRRPSRQVANLLADALQIGPVERPGFVLWARGVSQTPSSPAGTVQATTNEGPPTTELNRSPASPTTQAQDILPSSNAASLPVPLTPLVGREHEIALVRSLLWRSNTRLVTLTGPPGMGKTRLALAVAAALQDDLKEGLFYVPVAGVHDPELVPAAVAQGLGLNEIVGQPLSRTIQDALRDKQALVVIDNFEQVTEAAPLLSDILASAPQIKMLVTSRSPLHLHGEKLVNVQPLEYPGAEFASQNSKSASEGETSEPGTGSLELSARYSAIALFVDRAQDATSGFALSRENAPLVAEICRRVGGLPLGIELAAARTRLLSLPALLARLDRQLSLLTGGPRDAPVHQQTLRAALQSSYALLNPDEQQLFAQLGIFADPFTASAAEQVAGATLDTLQAILDQSLLYSHRSTVTSANGEASGMGDIRFAMLVPLREFALEKLDETGPRQDVSLAHARYILDLVRTCKGEFGGPDEKRAFDLVTSTFNDIRQAKDWALQNGQVELALQIASALDVFWQHGRLVEGARWLEEALNVSGALSPELRAEGLQVASLVAQSLSDFAGAKRYAQESLPIYQSLGDKHGIALAFSTLGVAAAEEGNYAGALDLFEQSLASWRDLGNTYNAATLLFNMSFLAVRSGDYDLAIRLSQESLDAFREVSGATGIITATIGLGLAHLHKGEYERSMALHKEGLAMAEELGAKRPAALAHTYIGLALLLQGHYDEADPHFHESLELSRELGNKYGVMRSLLALAGVAAGQGHPMLATRLLGAVGGSGYVLAKNLTPIEISLQEQTMARVRRALDNVDFNAAWTLGQAMPLDEAALQVTMDQ